MPKMCGELKAFVQPTGGGVHVTETVTREFYTDGTTQDKTSRNWYKSRMVFPLIHIGDAALEKAFVSGDPLGVPLAQYLSELPQGERICLYYFGHLLRKKVIIGVKSEKGESLTMPTKGFVSGLFWYAIFSPIIVAIPAAFVGMLVGSLGGRRGTALGLLLGVLYAVGISWYSGYRLFGAYREMQADTVKT